MSVPFYDLRVAVTLKFVLSLVRNGNMEILMRDFFVTTNDTPLTFSGCRILAHLYCSSSCSSSSSTGVLSVLYGVLYG